MSKWGDGKNNWGDHEEDGDEEKGDFAMSPMAAATPNVSIFESGPDKDGIKTYTEYRTDEDGNKLRVVRKVKVTRTTTRVNRNVLERRKWVKFGEATGKTAADEKNVTYVSFEQIHLNLAPKSREDKSKEADDDPLGKLKNTSFVKCRNCGETGHYTLQCPKRNEIKAKGVPDTPVRVKGLADAAAGKKIGGKYVPMHMREGAKEAMQANKMERDDSTTLRVTNLSEETTEDDLRELFRPFGRTSRVYLAKDRQSGVSRGFAFISFSDTQSCLKAIEKLNGHGYDNLILRVEFSKPRDDSVKTGPMAGAGVQNGAKSGGWSMRGTGQ